jgi:hypothetical protein
MDIKKSSQLSEVENDNSSSIDINEIVKPYLESGHGLL